jgi:DNA polymerase-4
LTYNVDLPNLKHCIAELPNLLDKLEQRIHRSNRQVSIRKIFVKLKFNDFISTTVEQVGQELDMQLLEQLCQTGYARGNKPVRLLGLGIRLREALNFYQLPLNFEDQNINFNK